MAKSSAAMGALSVPSASVRVSAIFVALSQILPIVANVATAHVELWAINCLYSEVGTGGEGIECQICSTGGEGCFPAVATVKLESGKSLAMSELQIEDRVQTGTNDILHICMLNIHE